MSNEIILTHILEETRLYKLGSQTKILGIAMKMMKRLMLFTTLLATSLLAAERRHLLNPGGTLTKSSGDPAQQIASRFIEGLSQELNFGPGDSDSVYLSKQYLTEHNGVTHLVYKQQYQGIEVYGAEWTVNIDRDGRVLNAGGILVPGPGQGTLAPKPTGLLQSVRAAVAAVNPQAATHFAAFQIKAQKGRRAVIAGGSLGADVNAEPIWFPLEGRLIPAYIVSVMDEDGVNSYEVIVNSESQRLLSKESLTKFQNAPRGKVFERENPQPNVTPGVRLTTAPPFVDRTWQSFKGDPTASPYGWLETDSTKGNNAIVGQNLLGVLFLANPKLAVSTNGEFDFPLQLGPTAPNPSNFSDASNTNLFYWINQAHDLFYSIGFNEGAGNYQKDNYGRGGVGGDAIFAYTHFGSQTVNSASLTNAFYTTQNTNDGEPSMVAMYLGAQGTFTDGAYDSQVIVHEYTHGVSNRLVRSLSGQQGGAMGEAWSDFFSLEFTIPEGAPLDGVYPTAGYLSQDFINGAFRSRPTTTDTTINPLTYSDMGKVIGRPEVHADGEIWVEALWDLRANLIKQWGEKEGRRRVRLLVIDGMKLSPPAPSMVDMRDAILLADRVDFAGASQQQLWAGFAKRGLGSLASSRGTLANNTIASFDLPSPAAKISFSRKEFSAGETVRIYLSDSNVTDQTVSLQLTTSSGDLETVTLRRNGNLFQADIGSTGGATLPVRENHRLEIVPSDSISAYYLDVDPGNGKAKQIELNVPTVQPYSLSYFNNTALQFAGEGTLFSPLTLQQLSPTAIISTGYTLPFGFPFFGQTLRRATIYSNGYIDFGTSGAQFCSTTSSLLQVKGIAAMLADIGITGVAQANENIYVSTTPTSVTFRWVGETITLAFNTRAEPVNFAITLFSDGRIETRYGAGNKNLTSYDNTCGAALPLVGISSGTSYALLSPLHLGLVSFENALTLRLDPPVNAISAPQAVLETPAAGAKVTNNLLITGVAWDTDASISRIDILVDGISLNRAQPSSILRTDFCGAQNVPGCPRIGFSATVDLLARGVKAGKHSVQLFATNNRGATVAFPDKPREFDLDFTTVAPKPPTIQIESPDEGSTLTGTTVFRGYILAGDLRIVGADVLIDGVTWGPAAYGGARPDICTSPAVATNCPGVGFTYTFNPISNLPISSGEHKLQIRARDLNGNFYLYPETPFPFTLDKPKNDPPIAVLTSPQPNEKVKGTVNVTGYAYDPDGRVVSVLVVVDQQRGFTATIGRPSPEVCAQLKDVAACPNIGFTLSLDTRSFTNGVHSMYISVADDKGAITRAPAAIYSGINFTVEN